MASVAHYITGHKQTQSNQACYFVSLVFFIPSKDLTFKTYLSSLQLMLRRVAVVNCLPVQHYSVDYMSLVVRKPVFRFPTKCDINQYVQLQKMARCLKFGIKVIEGLYYPYSESKGADQLRSHCAADLRLCFRRCKKPDF